MPTTNTRTRRNRGSTCYTVETADANGLPEIHRELATYSKDIAKMIVRDMRLFDVRARVVELPLLAADEQTAVNR
jgi:hypothetical protein